MECTIATLIACFNLSGLYIDGGLQYNDYDTLRLGYTDSVTLGVETISYQTAIPERDNPYGRLALGYEIPFHNVSLRLEASHLSSLASDSDRGWNAISFNVRWHPFR